MRYKFKFWHKEEKQFISIWSRGWRFEPENGQIYASGMNVTERVDIVQWTGLTDRNGKEIYEGDIMTAHGLNGIVKWIDAGWRVEWKTYDSYLLQVRHGEVIGNIYENLELIDSLEVKHETD
ncbi:YopX family protein [Paenibacillus alba]|uniref:YopX family protein n=1 Tax=Paenibacillus alba TaxID=1197127 RepID=A0ABU6GEN6_9BACL|nr:YopX family protein [Paenibacillus alba]MEC0232685.1 YopX family protein [Paenibacillus alba]